MSRRYFDLTEKLILNSNKFLSGRHFMSFHVYFILFFLIIPETGVFELSN